MPVKKTTDEAVEKVAPKKTTKKSTTTAKKTTATKTAAKKTTTKKTTSSTTKKAATTKKPATKTTTKKVAKVEKVFKIERQDDKLRIQINDANFWLDEEESSRVALCLNRAMNPDDLPYPITGHSTYITYSNGIQAVILNVCKLDRKGNDFMFTVVYMKPDMSSYNVDRFFVTKAVMANYLGALVPDVTA